MKEVTAYTPVLLQAQINHQQAKPQGNRSNQQAADSILNLVRKAQGLPASIQKALAFTIKTSQLGLLLDLVADTSKPDIQATAYKMIQFRLKSRLISPVWHRFQAEPERHEYVELLKNYARSDLEARQHRARHHEDAHLAFVVMIGQAIASAMSVTPSPAAASSSKPTATTISTASAPGMTLPRQFDQMVIQHLIQSELPKMTSAQLIQRYDLDLPGPFAEDLLIQYFAQCSEMDFPKNLGVLSRLLDAVNAETRLWPVINHYYELIRPLQLDDRIGRQVVLHLKSRQIQDNENGIPTADPLTAKARRRFKFWQILASLRASGLQPRLIELLSRYYYLLDCEAETLPQVGVLIKMGRLVLVVRDHDEHFYLYPRNIFEETESGWLLSQMPGNNPRQDEADDVISADSAEQDSSAEPDASVETDAPAVTYEMTPRPWPIDQSMVMPARQALLNEQDKRPDEPSLIDLLVKNEIMSIIQLSLVDAHYLFARKIFDELSLFKGASPD